jgi:tetratricopeptide (TPR) repeat protein
MKSKSRQVFLRAGAARTALGWNCLLALALIAYLTPLAFADANADQWQTYMEASKDLPKGSDFVRRNAAQALHIAEKFGSTDPRYIKSLYRLAQIDRQTGNLKESESLLQKSLECMDKQTQAGEFIKANRLAAMLLLAQDYDDDKQFRLSEPLWRNILPLARQVDLEDQVETADCLHYMTQHYLQLDDLASASKYTDEFLEICSRNHRCNSGELVSFEAGYEGLCVRNVRKNDLPAAEAALKMALKVEHRIPDRMVAQATICGTAGKLCEIYCRESNNDKLKQFAAIAERSAIDVLGIHQSDLDSDRLKMPTNDNQRRVFEGLATVNHAEGKYNREEYFFKQIIKSRQEESVKNPSRDALVQLAGSYFFLGRLYFTLGRNKEAAVTLDKSLSVMERVGKNAPWLDELEPLIRENFDKLHNPQAAKATAARIAKLK